MQEPTTHIYKGVLEGMKKDGSRIKIAYRIAALVCFLVLFGVSYKGVGQQEKTGCDIVVLGDSILGQYRSDVSIPWQIGDILGKTVFNGALGGTSMSRNDREWSVGYTKDCLSVTALAEAIATQDFGVQQAVRSRENATGYFGVTIDSLCTIDFEEVEILLMGAGVNDYHAGTPIYPEDDDYDEYTYVGALRSAIRNIQEAYPDVRIVLMTPTYAWYPDKNLTCEEYNLGGGLLEQYVDAECQVAQEMGVEIIDLYHDFYPHEQWEDWQIYTDDGLHPNEAGRALIAETIADYLKETEVEE